VGESTPPTPASTTMRWVGARSSSMISLTHVRPRLSVDPSRGARLRLGWLTWHAAHGGNVSLTCRHFGISRPTFYRWQARFDALNLATLEDRSCRPRRVRSPAWTVDLVEAVRQLRQHYPRWG
jgi:hypothetical protein